MGLEITGKLLTKYAVQHVTDKFKKREFVLEITEEINGKPYTNFAKMQVVQAKCDILDSHSEGDAIKVFFNLKGSRNEKDGKVSYFTNLDVWKIEGQQQQYKPAAHPQQQYSAEPTTTPNPGRIPSEYQQADTESDLPF